MEPTKECYYCGRALYFPDSLPSPQGTKRYTWCAYDTGVGGDAAHCPVEGEHFPINIGLHALAQWRAKHKETDMSFRNRYILADEQRQLNEILETERKANGICEDGVDAAYKKVNDALGYTLLKRPEKVQIISGSFSFEAPLDYYGGLLDNAIRDAIRQQAGVYDDKLKNLAVSHVATERAR